MADALNGHDSHGDGAFNDADQLIQHPTIKDAHTRLLDMLAGWSDFLREETTVPDLPHFRDAVRDLYHVADSAGEHRSPEDVRDFVNQKLIPLLLRDSS